MIQMSLRVSDLMKSLMRIRFNNKYMMKQLFPWLNQLLRDIMVKLYKLNKNKGTIFAYGQTGCGKTHTMIGNLDDEA